MQNLHPAGQPRLVTMKVNGPLIIGMRCLSSGSRSCRGMGRSSSDGMNGRSGLTTISSPRRQVAPGEAADGLKITEIEDCQDSGGGTSRQVSVFSMRMPSSSIFNL